MLCFEQKMRNRRYTYENSFWIKKNFLKYLIRSKNVKFVDFKKLRLILIMKLFSNFPLTNGYLCGIL